MEKRGGGGVGESLWGCGEKIQHTCAGSSLHDALRVGTRAARQCAPLYVWGIFGAGQEGGWGGGPGGVRGDGPGGGGSGRVGGWGGGEQG